MNDKASRAVDSYRCLELWLNFGKWFFGTFLLGAAAVFLNQEFQNTRIELETINKENEFIAQFVDKALDEKLEKRRDFAEYFVRLAPTSESKGRWESYRDFTLELINEAERKEGTIVETERELAGLRMELQQARLAQENVSSLTETIAELEAQLSRQRRELSILRSQSSLESEATFRFNLPDFVGLQIVDAMFSGPPLTYYPVNVFSTAPAGSIVAQTPQAGLEVLQGEVVVLEVSDPTLSPDHKLFRRPGIK